MIKTTVIEKIVFAALLFMVGWLIWDWNDNKPICNATAHIMGDVDDF